MKTLIGIFEMRADADNAVQDLINEGFTSSDIQIRDYSEFAGGGQAGQRPDESSLHAFLRGIGMIGDDRTQAYKEGDYLVTVDADDAHADHAADILNRHGAVDVDRRASGYPQAEAAETEKAATPAKLESVEEQLKVGTRPIARGGVRIYTRQTERQVEEPISLHEEEVRVERHATDRPASEEDIGAFKEQSFEMRAEGEEPVVSKEARVKEEVTISKEATERKETIRETLRGTKVEVEPLSADEESAFRDVESEFHDDYDRQYSTTGAAYDEVLPAYRYGYRVGQDPSYRSADWDEVEPKVKQDWEDHSYGGWEFYREAIHRGWESAGRHH